MTPPSFASLTLSLLAALGTLFSPAVTNAPEGTPLSPVPRDTQYPSPPPELPLITAAAAAVFDPIENAYLLRRDAGRVLPIASISKMLTALVALERAGKESRVLITPEAMAAEGNAGNFLVGETFILKDLIAAMMVESSNDAAIAIAQHVGTVYGGDTFDDSQRIFVQLMNRKAWEAGMQNAHFQNPTGLDVNDETEASNTASVEDLVSLLLYTMQERPEILAWSTLPEHAIISEEGGEHTLKNINTFAATLPNFIGGKTGFTDNAGGVLVVVAELPLGSPKLFIVLGSTYTGRFTDMQALIRWTRQATIK